MTRSRQLRLHRHQRRSCRPRWRGSSAEAAAADAVPICVAALVRRLRSKREHWIHQGDDSSSHKGRALAYPSQDAVSDGVPLTSRGSCLKVPGVWQWYPALTGSPLWSLHAAKARWHVPLARFGSCLSWPKGSIPNTHDRPSGWKSRAICVSSCALMLLQTPTSDEMTSMTTESWYLYVKATDREMQSTPMEQRMAEHTLEEYGAARVVERSCKG